MARLFDDALSEKLELGSAVVTTPPFTMAGWFRSNDATVEQAVLSIGVNGSGFNRWTLALRGDVAGDPVRFSTVDGSSANDFDTTSGYSTGTWMHAACWAASASSRAVYLNGGNKNTSAVSKTVTGVNRTRVGYNSSAAAPKYMSGDIAEAAIWNRALSDAEIASLAAGFSPLCYPVGLVFYCPLVRDIINFVAGGNPTATGTAVSAHPRVIRPSRPRILRTPEPVILMGQACM